MCHSPLYSLCWCIFIDFRAPLFKYTSKKYCILSTWITYKRTLSFLMVWITLELGINGYWYASLPATCTAYIYFTTVFKDVPIQLQENFEWCIRYICVTHICIHNVYFPNSQNIKKQSHERMIIEKWFFGYVVAIHCLLVCYMDQMCRNIALQQCKDSRRRILQVMNLTWCKNNKSGVREQRVI